MINFCIKNLGQTLIKSYHKKMLISEVLEELNIKVDKPCNGKGVCGKCKVIATGDLSPITQTELQILNKRELESNIRLSCLTYALGEVYIENLITNESIITGKIEKTEAIDKQDTLNKSDKFHKNPIVTKDECYGIAIDIGTTTVVAYLYKFPESICIEKICEINAQTKYGADVISRIEYANQGGLLILQEIISNQLKGIEKRFSKPIDTIVITGNTIMLYLYTGYNPEELAIYPFATKHLFGEWVDKKYLVPCICAYIGGDITSGILASDMLEDKTSFLVDIGTNGEMALWHNKKLLCASTAAGPVFEGSGISMGMIAKTGAINKVYIEAGKLRYNTIDNAEPIGICGSGIIDAVACMLELNILDDTGYLTNDYEISNSKVYITKKDIRQIQLAKAAIRAGINTLLHESAIDYLEIQNFYIAGNFGSFINKESAGKIGLIPAEVLEKVIILGNAAANGAAIILQSKEALNQANKIAKMAKSIHLANNEFFMEDYINQMMF